MSTAELIRSFSGSSSARIRRSSGLNRRLERLGNQRLLVLLLRLVAAAIKAMHCAALRRGSIGRSTMPAVRIHHDNVSRPEPVTSTLLRMYGFGSAVRLWQSPPAMRSGNDAKRAVLLGEIIQHPDRIANPVAAFVRDRTHIRVQRLQANPSRDSPSERSGCSA